MPKFYFTYGSDEKYPFRGGWTLIVAPDKHTAVELFRAYHPNPRPGAGEILNCSSCYDEEKFARSKMSESGNLGARCHEIIKVTRIECGELGEGDIEAVRATASAEKKICSICGGEYYGHGHNAAPVNDGQCCDKCNLDVVVPRRFEERRENDAENFI